MTRMSVVVFLMLVSAASGASAQQIGSVGEGMKLAKDVCAACHAIGRDETRSPDAKAAAFDKLAKTPGITSVALVAALQTSHRTMPNLVIKGDDLANVVVYILSLQ